MKEYAFTYPNLKIGDGTHKLSQYDFVFVIRSTIDCLSCTHIIGVTAHFSEHSESMIEGVKLFFSVSKTNLTTSKLVNLPFISVLSTIL